MTVMALGWAPAASAAPLKARFGLVNSRAVTRTITAARGGTLSLTAPGGVRIVVRIPPRALVADTKVTATPITRFRVPPVHGGFVAGVQLAPEGLSLLKPGSVEFRARRGLKPTSRYFLGTPSSGSGVYLVPPAFHKIGRGRNAKLRVVSRPIVPILHFSTDEAFDWSKASLRDLSDLGDPRYVRSALDRAREEIASRLGLEKGGQLVRWQDETSYNEMLQVMERFRDRVINPHLQVVAAELASHCNPQAFQNAYGALTLALDFVRQEEQLDLPTNLTKAKLMGPILSATANCMLKLCSQYGPRLTDFLFRTAYQADLLAGGLESNAWVEALTHNISACSKGEVHLDSTFTQDDDQPSASDHFFMRAGGRAPFEASPDNHWNYQEAPLDYQDVHGSSRISFGQDCELHDTLTANANGVFKINQLQFSQFDPTKPDTAAPIEKLSLAITQNPTELLTVSAVGAGCLNTDPGPPSAVSWWATALGGSHPALPTPSFTGSDFIRAGAPVIALAVYTENVPAAGGVTGNATENTLVEVISKPGPLAPLPDPFSAPNDNGSGDRHASKRTARSSSPIRYSPSSRNLRGS